MSPNRFHKLVLLLLAVAEIIECVCLAPTLSFIRATCLLLVLPVYLLLFHICLDEEFRAHVFSRLRRIG